VDYLIGFLLGMAVVWLWPRLRRQFGQSAEQDRASASAVPLISVATDAGLSPSAATEPESLSSRLTALFNAIDPETNTSAHPRELIANSKFAEARRLLADENVPIAVVRDYAIGSNWFFSCAALAALFDRDDRDEALPLVGTYFDTLTPWAMHFALSAYTVADPRPPTGSPLLSAREWWRDNMFVITAFREHFEERSSLGDAAEFGPGLDGISPETREIVKAILARVSHPMAAGLLTALETARLMTIDRAFLATFGRFWQPAANDVLVEPTYWADALAETGSNVLGAHPRSLLVSGEVRVGKTSFLKLLGRRLEWLGWSVFEASGADLMAGQKWFGELEGRIQRTIEELAASKKVVWYIPDILQIALSGTHQGQAASILDQILPAITAGRLIVWTEASAAGTSRIVRLRPSLRGTFEVARLEPMEPDETEELARDVARAITSANGVKVEPAAIDAAIASARQYLTASSLPGAALDLLKLSVNRAAKGTGATVSRSDIIETLSQLTGLPASILDNHQRVDLSAVRSYFSARVIGQDEAVGAIVDRIAMLKAGLNDPGKPIGVFLFAGPTGTGKTELAKTLAEFLFGTQERMIRLDMSEFQTAESTAKILGSGDTVNPTDSLITLVRKQPFSVVLLDEFEKAHASVWDLFLQVFDDGRLTDQLGQVADFRHCIIILTSNLGATSHRSARLGFSPGDDAYSGEQVLRAVSQTFRPEFQNRLDKVIVFRPLSRELMRDILKKELARVLDRRGFKDREWAVEWEASALEFLLERGFTPEMGARPLKRAIDQFLIAPLAATIVEQRFPQGDQFVFVRSDGRAIQAEFVDPDADTATLPFIKPTHERPTLVEMILSPQGNEAERHALEAEIGTLDETLASEGWEALKGELSAAMLEAGFWSNPNRHATLARLALMDRVKAAAETARSLKARLDKGSERAGKASRELVSRIALQVHLVGEGIKDVLASAPIEVVVAVEPAFEKPGEAKASLAWCEQVLGMYRGWSGKRRMQLTEVADGGQLPTLLISGFGAHRVLALEAGLHVLELSDDDRSPARATARVRIGVAPLEEQSKAKLKQALKAALNGGASSNTVVRRYRGDAAPLVRDLGGGWRSGRLDDVLAGDFDLIARNR
jgi:ATP-dependent Clp protease ATP-binding subunit ClpC